MAPAHRLVNIKYKYMKTEAELPVHAQPLLAILPGNGQRGL